MSTISTTSQPATSVSLRRVIRGHPLVAYFVIAFVGTWAFFLPFVLSRGGEWAWSPPLHAPRYRAVCGFYPRYRCRAGPGIPHRDGHHVGQSGGGTSPAPLCAMASGRPMVSDRHLRLFPGVLCGL